MGPSSVAVAVRLVSIEAREKVYLFVSPCNFVFSYSIRMTMTYIHQPRVCGLDPRRGQSCR